MTTSGSLLTPTLDLSVADRAHPYIAGVDIESLFAHASAARVRSYAPYSQFAVGAALLATDGSVIAGGNVENESYGLTICAERAAVVRALAEGHTSFAAIAIAVNIGAGDTAVSCGACLQVLTEFDPDEQLVVIFPDGNLLRVVLLAELLPVRFRIRS
jgi:cytidine deaminase